MGSLWEAFILKGTGITLVNLDRVLKKVQIDDRLDEAVERIAYSVEAEAKRICPVDTGRLRASIHSMRIKKGAYYVGTNVEYAPFVEYGTKKMRAQPYLRPAVRKVVNMVKLQGIRIFIE